MQGGSPFLRRLVRGPRCPACKWRLQPTYRGCPYPSAVSRAGVRGEFDPHGTVRPSHSPGANLHRGLGVTNPGNDINRFRNFRNGSRIRTQLGWRQRDRLRTSEQVVDGRVHLLKTVPPILTHYSNIVSNLTCSKCRSTIDPRHESPGHSRDTSLPPPDPVGQRAQPFTPGGCAPQFQKSRRSRVAI